MVGKNLDIDAFFEIHSLIAQLVPARRRSTGYGFSNMICFGLGGLGPFIIGQSVDNRVIYGGLAGVVALSALLAAGLWWMTRTRAAVSDDLTTATPPDENP